MLALRLVARCPHENGSDAKRGERRCGRYWVRMRKWVNNENLAEIGSMIVVQSKRYSYLKESSLDLMISSITSVLATRSSMYVRMISLSVPSGMLLPSTIAAILKVG